MKIAELYKDKTDCNCTESGFEDIQNTYVRLAQLSKVQPKMKLKEFKGQYESKQNEYFKDKDCKETCGMLGVSTNLWNSESKESVTEKLKANNRFLSSKRKRVLVVYRLNKDAGLFVHDPEPEDEYHFNFFRSEEFDLSQHFIELEQIDV